MIHTNEPVSKSYTDVSIAKADGTHARYPFSVVEAAKVHLRAWGVPESDLNRVLATQTELLDSLLETYRRG